jgi:hypothetical protein
MRKLTGLITSKMILLHSISAEHEENIKEDISASDGRQFGQKLKCFNAKVNRAAYIDEPSEAELLLTCIQNCFT